MNISTEFQEFVLIVVAPLVYDGLAVLLVLSLIVAGAMPLLAIARILRGYSNRGM